jgi:GrpB-like predicted nucleotidyltransferase (UPF0157 family)
MGSPLGLDHGKVRLADADPRWPELVAAEIERIRPAIDPHVMAIEHFGSTSITGIKAKPILDILVGLRRFEDGEKLVRPLVSLGYDYVGSDMVPEDHLFGLGQARTVLLHCVVHGGYHWTRNLRFRDALRADAAPSAEYEALKVRLAEEFADSRSGYTAAKQSFIDRIADATQ